VTAPDGVLIVDKPAGMTSHDVVATVRRRLPRKTKVGHTGTLDPFATGVLPVVIGKATRLSQFLTASRKQYLATVTFGEATDSGDLMGVMTETASPAALAGLTEAAVHAALATFVGRHAQLPPAHSAKKVDGQRAYVLARRGEAVALAAVEVTAHALSLVSWDGSTHSATVRLDVSAGYYVRSLARDLGARLGVPAHLTALRRTASGMWSLEQAHSLADVVQCSPEDFLRLCQPLGSGLGDWPVLALNEGQMAAVLAGRPVDLDDAQSAGLGGVRPERVRLIDATGALVALARPTLPRAVHADIVLR